MKHENEDCHEEEECFAVKGCKRGRPVRVKFDDDCDPIPVVIDEDCKPIAVKIKGDECDPVTVQQKPHSCWRVQGCKDGDPVEVAQTHCWEVQGCEDGFPVNVNIVNQPPPPPADTNQHVFNGSSWEPLLTPSAFVPFVNVQVPSGAPGMPIWTPAAGNRFRMMSIAFTGSVAGRYTLRDGNGGPILAAITLVANVPFVLPILGNGIASGAVGNPLFLEFNDSVTTVTTVTGTIVGQEHP